MAAWRTPRIPSFADPHRGVQLCESARPIVHCLAAPARERKRERKVGEVRGADRLETRRVTSIITTVVRSMVGWQARCFCAGKTGTFETRAEVLLHEEEVANRLVAILNPPGNDFCPDS